MNIAIFTDTYLPQINGVVTSTVTFAEEYEKLGHTVYIFAPKVERGLKSTDQIWRFRSVMYPGQPEYQVCIPWSRRLKKFESLDIDVIHAQTPFSMGFLAQHLAKKNNLPLIHTYHTLFAKYVHYIPLLPKVITEKYAYWESRRFCNKCEVVIVPSGRMKSTLDEYGINVPIEIVPTGINLDRFSKLASSDDVLSRFNIPKHHKRLVFVGRLGVEKNVYFLLKAFKKILQKQPDTTLLIVGDGPEKKALEQESENQGFRSKVVFAGYMNRSDVYSAFQGADVCVFPSVTETQGLIVLESLVSGTPVVGINAMGVGDVLAGEAGGLLAKEDVSDFAEKTLQLLTDEILYKQKVEEAANRVQEFSSTKLAKRMLSIYETAIEEKKQKSDID